MSCKDCKNRKQEREEFNAKVQENKNKYCAVREYEIKRHEKIKKSQNKH